MNGKPVHYEIKPLVWIETKNLFCFLSSDTQGGVKGSEPPKKEKSSVCASFFESIL